MADATGRPSQPEPYLRGAPFPAGGGVPYPRAKPEVPLMRVPMDTWTMAKVPAGVRLELTGDAAEIEVDYLAEQAAFGYLGGGEGGEFTVWDSDEVLASVPAEVGAGTVRLPGPAGRGRLVVHLPERMMPTVREVRAAGGGAIEPGPAFPRWIAYGDSITEGWTVSSPGRSWSMLAARRHGLDVTNMGYSGSARGEIPSAEEIAALPADVITLAHGTNCWTRIPFSVGMFREGLNAFVDIVRQGHPETPIVVVSPITRPDAEATPNRLGATLVDLRAVFEDVVNERIAGGDTRLSLVEGFPLVTPDQLDDGIHPGDAGHAAMAAAIGPAVAAAAGTA
ncbi:MAG TPA: SGNH/GDSL hydrolase family protein [Acidimicrobiales bacterium]|nr:SGNH/GDSL hydrolase family protein [Acidimicrobiales bacterium]